VFAFLGIDPEAKMPGLHPRLNAADTKTELPMRLGKLRRAIQPTGPLEPVPLSWKFRAAIRRPVVPPSLSEDLAAHFRKLLAPDLREFHSILRLNSTTLTEPWMHEGP
jgi:hypothetical protein